MITIDEIKNISFRKANLGGYRPEDVDSFIDEVIASFEQLKKEKTNLVHKIDVLATRVEQYRSDEETVRNALLASQKVADACIREAKEKAAKITREAENKAQALLIEANNTTAVEKDNYLKLQSDAVSLRGELIELYKKHIKSIDELPTTADVENSKNMLNQKYPTTEISAPQPTSEPEAISNQAPLETITDNEQTVAEDNSNTEPKHAQNSQNAGKFSHLKFGENYDVSAD